MSKVDDPQGKVYLLTCTSKYPLEGWEKQLRKGYIRRRKAGAPLEMTSINLASTFVTTPFSPYDTLSIGLPELVVAGKAMGQRPFAFEVMVEDDRGVRRRFHVSKLEKSFHRIGNTAYLPLDLPDGWIEMTLDLVRLTRRIFNTNYVQTLRVAIHPNFYLAEVFFQSSGVAIDLSKRKKSPLGIISSGRRTSFDQISRGLVSRRQSGKSVRNNSIKEVTPKSSSQIPPQDQATPKKEEEPFQIDKDRKVSPKKRKSEKSQNSLSRSGKVSKTKL